MSKFNAPDDILDIEITSRGFIVPVLHTKIMGKDVEACCDFSGYCTVSDFKLSKALKDPIQREMLMYKIINADKDNNEQRLKGFLLKDFIDHVPSETVGKFYDILFGQEEKNRLD